MHIYPNHSLKHIKICPWLHLLTFQFLYSHFKQLKKVVQIKYIYPWQPNSHFNLYIIRRRSAFAQIAIPVAGGAFVAASEYHLYAVQQEGKLINNSFNNYLIIN